MVLVEKQSSRISIVRGLTMDENGSQSMLFTMDKHEVRRYRVGDTEGIVVAGGNGKGDRVLINSLLPYYVFVDRDHSVYVSDVENHRVMKWEEGAKEGIVCRWWSRTRK